jgi:tetratricopeptide (TPR) repeat protein
MHTEFSTALASLKSDPANPRALDTLTQLHPGNGAGGDHEATAAALLEARNWHAGQGDVELCVQFLDIQLAWTPSGATRVELLAEKARLLHYELLRSIEARACLKDALDADKDHKIASELARAIEAEEASWQQEAEAIMEQAQAQVQESAGGGQAAQAWAAVGELCVRFSPQSDEGEAYLKRSIELDPRHERANVMLERLLRRAGRVEDLRTHLERRIATAGSQTVEELPLQLSLGRLYRTQLARPDQAEICYRRIKKLSPLHPEVMEFYKEYHTARGELPRWLALLGEAQRAASDTETQIRFGMQIAELAETQPQWIEKAIDAWKGLLRLKPGLPEAVAGLKRLYTQARKWNALLEIMKDDLEALPASAIAERVRLHFEMLPIYQDQLQLEVMVVNTYLAILKLQPDNTEALEALAGRYEAQGRWSDLAQVFTRQAEATGDVGVKVALYHRIADLWAQKASKPQHAVTALETILAMAPGDARALRALKDLYTQGRSWTVLLDLMTRELATLPRDQKRGQLSAMARLAAEKLSDANRAIELWNDLLAIEPSDGEALEMLAVLYDRGKRWPALAEVLGRQAAAGTVDTPEWGAVLARRGLLLHEKLGANAEAPGVSPSERECSKGHAGGARDPRRAGGFRGARNLV